MAGPSWLAGIFAAVVILTAAYSASRLAASRLRGRATELDADALHAVMGAAMAGMLVPRLNVLPDRAWAAVFGIAAMWFGWHAIRGPGLGTSSRSRCRFPLPHLIECAAMLYMLLPAHAGPGMSMPGASTSPGPAGFPALAVVLALFMLGYIIWTTDRLTFLARARTSAAGPARNTDQPPAAAPGTGPLLAPKLGACGKLAMSITMGYMLILML